MDDESVIVSAGLIDAETGSVAAYEAVRGRDECLYAIQVRRLIYSYSEYKHVVNILNRLSMNVPLGQIYGLLGPSGCGKTTLIRCILGILKPESGEIRLFHRRPNSTNRNMPQIPGKDVGYMPQEYALYGNLTVLETIYYHKAIHSLSNNKFGAFKLLDLLELGPFSSRMVANLSGGQTRRLSFACALVHKPRLLILDEPTVGVDPILRHRIWNILEDYVSDQRASVLITTHYIEETRRAQRVGFMRRGHLLAENSPANLLKMYQVNELEQVFYKLCVKQKRQSKLWKRTSLKSAASLMRKRLDKQLEEMERHQELTGGGDVEFASDTVQAVIKNSASAIHLAPNCRPQSAKCRRKENQERKSQVDQLLHIRQPNFLISRLVWLYKLNVTSKRIMKQTMRQREALFAQFILSLFSLLLFYLCVGGTPQNVQIAVVNQEVQPHFSQLFLSRLNTKMIQPVNYTDLPSALSSVRNQTSWGVLLFPVNFTEALTERAQLQAETRAEEMNDTVIEQSTIRLHADLSNRILSVTMQRSLDTSLQKFLQQVLNELGIRASLLQLPIRLEQAIYGQHYNVSSDEYYALRDYGVSGILIILTYSLSFGLTVMILAEENSGSMFERNYVAGVSSTIVIFAHLMVRLLLCMFNVALLLVVAVQLFNAPITGPLIWAYAILLAQCLTGLTHGMMISALCSDFFMAAVLSNGVLLMMFILSGVLWPVESLPRVLRYFSLLQPTTLPTESLRWILSKGHDIHEPHVYRGFAISLFYCVTFFVLAAIIFRTKR